MKKCILATLLLLSVAVTNSFSQTTATDFTTNDCAGVSHHLFAELEAGYIIVLVFVMPCDGCISPAIDARTIAGSYGAAYPGKVFMYLVDDDGASTCPTLYSWRNAHGIGLVTTFSSPDVVQTQYGTPGMPKIVVLGGANHHIYYNENNGVDTTQLHNAIDAAIAGITATPSLNRNISATLFPSPATDRAILSYELATATDVAADIYDLAGIKNKTVIKETQGVGKHLLNINLDGLSNGYYFLRLRAGNSGQTLRFTVAR